MTCSYRACRHGNATAATWYSLCAADHIMPERRAGLGDGARMYTMAAAPPSAPRTPITSSGSSALATAWPRSAQLAAAFIIGAATAVLAINALGYWRASKPSELERGVIPTYRIDLNAADH